MPLWEVTYQDDDKNDHFILVVADTYVQIEPALRDYLDSEPDDESPVLTEIKLSPRMVIDRSGLVI